MKLGQDSKLNIETAVNSAEQWTSAEIAWQVVRRSSSYQDVALIWAFIMMLIGLAAKILYDFDNSWNGSDMVTFADIIACFIAGILISKIPFCRRLLISNERMKRRVDERAQASFFKHGLTDTAGHNGVLVYASIFEKIIVVVADSGILKVQEMKEFLSNPGKELSIGRRHWKDGSDLSVDITHTILNLGVRLKKHFPAQPDDRDELPNGAIGDDEEKD